MRELILFSWSEHFSTQGPEHCHIDFVKKIAHCTNNKEVFLTILRHHVREGRLPYLNQLRADLYAEDHNEMDEAFNSHDRIEAESAANDSLPCELGSWTSVSAVAVHHGWAKEPSDSTGENISIPANSDAQNVPSFRRWRFEMKLSPFIVYDFVYDIVFDVVYDKNIQKHISFIVYDIKYDIEYSIAYDIISIN